MLPAQPVRAPLGTLLTGTIIDAATVVTQEPARHIGAIDVHSPLVGDTALWENTCPPGGTKTFGGRPGPREFPSITVTAGIQCHTVGTTDEEFRDQAVAALKRMLPVRLEQHLAPRLTTTGASREVKNVVQAVAFVEEALATTGQAGVIHASRRMLPVMERADMILRQGASLFSPGGHRWVFGAGYTALGTTLVGTGPVVVIQGDPAVSGLLDARQNDRYMLAEQIVAAGWDGPEIRVTITGVPGGDDEVGGVVLPSTTLTPNPALVPTGGAR